MPDDDCTTTTLVPVETHHSPTVGALHEEYLSSRPPPTGTDGKRGSFATISCRPPFRPSAKATGAARGRPRPAQKRTPIPKDRSASGRSRTSLTTDVPHEPVPAAVPSETNVSTEWNSSLPMKNSLFPETIDSFDPRVDTRRLGDPEVLDEKRRAIRRRAMVPGEESRREPALQRRRASDFSCRSASHKCRSGPGGHAIETHNAAACAASSSAPPATSTTGRALSCARSRGPTPTACPRRRRAASRSTSASPTPRGTTRCSRSWTCPATRNS